MRQEACSLPFCKFHVVSLAVPLHTQTHMHTDILLDKNYGRLQVWSSFPHWTSRPSEINMESFTPFHTTQPSLSHLAF